MDLEPFSLPLSRPLETAAGKIQTRRGFVVRVEIDGTVGVGEATPLAGWTESVAECRRALAAVDDPRSALETDGLTETPAARHGLSLAVLDAAARSDGRPLYRHLGAERRVASVPVNATVGDSSASEAVAAVEAAVESGYPAVKLKVGKRRPDVDIERIEAVRERCPEIELRVDVNGGWIIETAERIVPELAKLDVAIVEQPLPAAELHAHERLRGHGVEIAIDEGVIEYDPETVLDAGVADVLVCKPMVLGGVDIAHRTAGSAREAGTDVLVTTTIDGAIARAGAVHLAASVPDIRPCGLATDGLLRSDLRDDVCPVTDGAAAVPQGKGNIPPR